MGDLISSVAWYASCHTLFSLLLADPPYVGSRGESPHVTHQNSL
jgi:hypothetical protein